ncbi:MAG: ADP-glyceromanno-heptose 6-epimerase [Mariprofundaceae bacterium]
MQHILITGGAGFIGANLAAALTKKPGCRVVVADNFKSGDWRNLIHINCEVRATESNDPALLKDIADGKFTAVMHQAAITDTTIMDQNLMISVNTNAFADILKASSHSGTRVVYASSAGVYGNSPAPNKIGNGEIPENIYGFSKLAMDRIMHDRLEHHPSIMVGLRYFNVYGPGESHKGKTSSMILQLYQQVKAGRQPRLFKFGEQKRDFVYIGDIVAANLAALEAPRSGICNVGSGRSRSFNDIIAILGRILGKELKTEFIDNPYEFYQNHTQADLRESRALLDWEPNWSLEDGMDEYIRLLECGSQANFGEKT